MKFYDENIVNQARKLREQGLSSKKIAKMLGVSDSTILRWCYDIKTYKKNAFSEYQRHIYQTLEEKSKDVFKDFKININNAKILTAILYYCEGSRYPTANYLCFTNSDPQMIQLFMKLFQLGFKPDETKFRILLQLHTTHNKTELRKYWSKLLKINEKQFYKPTITNPTKRMKRRNYKGTCSIRYYDFKVLHEIFGIWKYLVNKV